MYKGESWSKKIARAWMWDAMVSGVTIRKDRYLVLASRECGDMSLLKWAGVPAENITAVDLESSAIDACNMRYPEVTAVKGDVGEVAEGLGDSPTVVMLDFCGRLSVPTMEATLRVARTLKPGSRLGIVTMKGRESDATTATLIRGHYRITRKNKKSLLIKILKTLGDGDFREVVNILPPSLKKEIPVAGAWIRATAWEYLLNTLGKTFSLREVVEYNSGDGGAHGSPMLGLIFDVWPKNMRALPLPKYSKVPPVTKELFQQFVLEGIERHVVSDNWEYGRVGYIHLLGERIGDESGTEDIAGIYNIPTSTLGAWKAHYTRGSYGWSPRDMQVAQLALVNWPVRGDLVYFADADTWMDGSRAFPTKGYVLPGRVVNRRYGDGGWAFGVEADREECGGDFGIGCFKRTGTEAFADLLNTGIPINEDPDDEECIFLADYITGVYLPYQQCYPIRQPSKPIGPRSSGVYCHRLL